MVHDEGVREDMRGKNGRRVQCKAHAGRSDSERGAVFRFCYLVRNQSRQPCSKQVFLNPSPRMILLDSGRVMFVFGTYGSSMGRRGSGRCGGVLPIRNPSRLGHGSDAPSPLLVAEHFW